MPTRRTLTFASLVVLSMMIFLGSFGVPTHASEQQALQLFFDDFGPDAIGSLPTDWTVNYSGRAQIVSAPDLPSGKAVLVRADSEQERDTHFRGPVWQIDHGDPTTVAVEFHVHWLQGRGINIYASSSRAHHVNLHIADGGVLRYRQPEGYVDVGQLRDGWNRVMFVANLDANEVVVYLNDFETSAAGPLPFRTPLESWEDVYLLALHSRSAVDAGADPEVMYGNFKVWAFEAP